MRQAPWLLLPVMLVVGAVGGYVARGTRTSTVVQIQTVAPPPPATHELTARFSGVSGACLSSDPSGDTFTLRRPGNGLTEGDVVGVANQQALDESSCFLNVTFSISGETGFFVVYDDSKGVHWGPFDSRSLASRDWTVRLNYSGD